MPEPRVCCLSEAEASALTQNGVRPDCRAHASRHVSKKEAEEWLRNDYGPRHRVTKTYRSMGGQQTVVSERYRAQARWVTGYEGKFLIVEALRFWQAYRGSLQLLPFLPKAKKATSKSRMPSRSNGKPGVMVMPSKSQQLLENSRVDAITHR